MAIANYNFEIDVKSEKRRSAIKVKSAKTLNAGGFGRKCSECSFLIPSGSELIQDVSGAVRCPGCESLKKYCVICSAPFYSRVNNKVTDTLTCSREYELRRAKERYQELSARANASY